MSLQEKDTDRSHSHRRDTNTLLKQIPATVRYGGAHFNPGTQVSCGYIKFKTSQVDMRGCLKRRGWGMALWAKYLLHKSGEWSLDPQNPHGWVGGCGSLPVILADSRGRVPQ